MCASLPVGVLVQAGTSGALATESGAGSRSSASGKKGTTLRTRCSIQLSYVPVFGSDSGANWKEEKHANHEKCFLPCGIQ